jgi:hypothetical protein
MDMFNCVSDEKLISNTRSAIEVETRATTNVVRHFVEIYKRELFLARGYNSMFLMAREEFGYDKASAQRRVNAMELSLSVPETLEMIDRRELCLQSAADIQTFLNFERGLRIPYSTEQKLELVLKCSGLSTREVQLELANRNPDLDFRESKKMVAKERMQVTYTTSVATEEKLERIKQLRSHANPYMNREQLMDYMAEIVLDKIDPLRKDERAEQRQQHQKESAARRQHLKGGSAEVATDEVPAQEPKAAFIEEVVSEAGEIQLAVDLNVESAIYENGTIQVPAQEPTRTRYIRTQDRRAVRSRNQNRGCEYVDEQSGHECGSKHQLQFDHVTAYSSGGSSDETNLRTVCAKHNRFAWRGNQSTGIRTPELAYG